MTLDASALQSAIRSILDSAQPSAAASADAFAGAYDDYCQGATFGASTPTLTGKRYRLADSPGGVRCGRGGLLDRGACGGAPNGRVRYMPGGGRGVRDDRGSAPGA